MKTPNPTVANADLWSAYLRQQWSRWLDPIGGAGATESFAAGISTLYTLALGDFIARLFVDNAPHVNDFLDHRVAEPDVAAVEEPEEAPPCQAGVETVVDNVPAWMIQREPAPCPPPAYAPVFYERATA